MTIIGLLRNACAMLLASAGIARFELEIAKSHYDRRGRGGSASKAAYWARRAASRGSSEAQRILAAFYIASFGVEQNYAEAARLYKVAADAGDPLAHFSYAWCCTQGVGVEKSPELAFHHWLKAAAAGVADAQAAVAECLLTGRGTDVDLTLAAEWARLAVKNEAEGASELLGRIEAAAGATAGKSGW